MSTQNGVSIGSSSGTSTPSVKPDPLGFLTRLNESVYVRRPASSSPPASGPRLVLLCTWMGAQPTHMAKYVKPYTELYPDSPVVVVRSEMRHFVRPRTLEEVQLGADAILAEFPELEKQSDTVSTAETISSTSPPPLLIHVWSNGGSSTLMHLARRLPSLPKYTIVFDSTPGQFRYKSTHTAMLATVPPWLRRLLSPAIHLLCMYWWLITQFGKRVLGKRLDALSVTAAAQNTPERLALEVRRSYIYSKEDALIPWEDVEEHAAEAKAKGANVRLELFKGVHVGHLRTDPERYWKVVKETYEGKESPAADGAKQIEATA